MTSVFISYSSKDSKIAEGIQIFLEDEGFDVWRDKSRIETDWSKEIAGALSRQDVVFSLWSEDSSQSQWVKNEWITARALGKPIILVVISALDELPSPLRNLDAIVINNIDINSNIKQQIIKKIKDSADNIEYDYKILPPNRNIPYDPNPDFAGRNTELVDLYLDVLGDLSKLNYSKVGLVGIGGVGKTQLAVEFAYRFGYAFESGIYWIQATDSTSWVPQIVNIAKNQLGLKIPNPDVNIADINRQYFIEFKKYCGKYGSKILLVIDNVIEPLDLHKDDILFPGDPTAKFTVLTLGCNLLFTTKRDFENRLPNIIQHELKMLLPEAAYNLLVKYRKPDSKQEEEFGKKICNSIGNLPLAIVLIGSYLRKFSDLSIEEYYDEHIKNRLSSIDLDEISADELATRHEAAIRITFEPEWEILKGIHGKPKEIERNQNAEKLVSILSLLPESDIVPKKRLIVYSGIKKYGKTKLVRPAESAFIFLDELNLVDLLEKGKSVRIHPLLREYVLEKLEEQSAGNHITNLKIESIFNLKRTYYDDFASLVQEFIERDYDIDSILEDFRTVLLWSRDLTDDTRSSELGQNPIYELNKIIELESHNLRSTGNELFTVNTDKSILFAQQIHIRSIGLNNKDIAEKSREFLFRSKKSFLNIKWAKMYFGETLIRTLEGHTGPVISVGITADNLKVLSASADRTIKVWDLHTGKLLHTLVGHSDSVLSFAITSDNSKVVSASADMTIKVWDINIGKLLTTLDIQTEYVPSFAISKDSSKIVSAGSGRGTIKIWDINTGKLLNTLKAHAGPVKSVAVTTDSSKIVSAGSADMTIKVWDINTGKLLNTIRGNSDCNTEYSVGMASITSDDCKVVAGCYSSTLKVWDIKTGKLLNTIRDYTKPSNSIPSFTITSDNSKVIAAGSGGTNIKVWDINTGKLLNTLINGRYIPSFTITSDNSKVIAAGSHDKTIKVWDIDTHELVQDLHGHSDAVDSVAISPDNSKIVSGSVDMTIKVWDFSNKGKLLHGPRGHSDAVDSVAITSDCSKFISGSGSGAIDVWDINTGDLLHMLHGHTDSVRSLAVTSNNFKIVSGSWDKTAKVWEMNTGRLIHNLSHGTDGVFSVTISPDNSKIVSCSGWKPGTIRVWDINSGELLHTLQVQRHTRLPSIAITADNSKIISGSGSGIISIWNINTGKLLHTLRGKPDSEHSFAITQDCFKIVSNPNDGTLKVWDIHTGKLLHTLRGKISTNHSFAITSDNSKVVASDYDSTINVWDMRTGKLLHTLKSHSNEFAMSDQSIFVLTSDDSKIVSNPNDGTLKVWDLHTGKLLHTLVGHSDRVLSFAITSDNSKVVSGSTDRGLNVWDMVSGKCYWRYKFDSYMISIRSFRDTNLILMVDVLGNGFLVCLS